MRTTIVIGTTLALLAVGACNRESPGSSLDGSTTQDAAANVDAGPGTDGNVLSDGAVIPDAGPDPCAAEVAALAAEIYANLDGCSAVVRLDHNTMEILGYQLICGNYAQVNETEARATAQTATGYGSSGTMLNTVPPDGPYVFYMSPGDFGGVGAVSSDTGLALFGGSIIWMGGGDITYPATWRPAADLASGCNPSGGAGVAYGYDLVADGAALSTADVNAAVAVVADTALMQAFWGGGYVFTTVVLRYPRTVGAFDPTTGEWIVLLSGGWLE